MEGAKPNIVVFGETGAGKSSLVNLILGQKQAKVSDDAIGCTFQYEKFETSDYNIFDTVGLAEGSKGTMNQKNAVSNLVKLLKSLETGVSLLIFVMEKGRIKKTLEENYKLFVRVICDSKVPVLLCITKCEMEEPRDKWWTDNKHHFDNYDMSFQGVISGCCRDPMTVPDTMRSIVRKMNEDTLNDLKDQISKNMLNPPWVYKGGWKGWFTNIISGVVALLVGVGESILSVLTFGLYKPSTSELGRSDIFKRLRKYFIEQGHDEATATEMAKSIEDLVEKD